jgi:cobalt/nickel transport system permease protein
MRTTFELFSDIFAARENRLSRIDARAKLVVCLAAIILVLLSKSAGFPLMMLLGCLAGMLAVRLPLKLVLARVAAPMVGVCVLIVLMTFTSGQTALAELSFVGFHWTATQEGLSRGLLMGARVMGSVSAIMLMSFVTPAHQVFHALRWMRVPGDWIEIAALMYRYTFMLVEQVSDITAAQRLRLGYSGFRRSLSSMGTLGGAVAVRSLDQAVSTHEAMLARGYSGSMPFGPMPPMKTADRLLIFLLPALMVTVYIIIEWIMSA